MPIELKPGTRSGAATNVAEALAGLDNLASYGVRVDHPKLRPARKAADRVRSLRQSNETIRARASGGDAALTKIAEEYARGDITPDAVPEAVGSIAALRNGSDALRTVLARAEAAASAPGIECCAQLGDLWLTEILRPAVDRVLGELAEVAEPAWDALHMSEARLKQDRPRRDALDRVSDAVGTLDKLRDHATGLRNASWVPTPGRPGALGAEAFGWLRQDKLTGDLGDRNYARYFLRNYVAGAEPGVWTGDEIVAANPGLLDAEPTPPKPPRGGDAHYANAGKREVA